jgi:MFS family permease
MAEHDNDAETGKPVPPVGGPYAWYVLALLVLVYVMNFIDRQILSILAEDIKRDLDLTDAQLGFLYGTAFAVFYALFGVPIGRLADNWVRTRLLALGLTLWSGMTAMSGLAGSFTQLSLARIGVGVGEAAAGPSAYSMISDWFPKARRATAISIYAAGLYLGGGVSLLIGAVVVKGWNTAYPGGGPLGLVGWQAAFMAVGIPGLLLALWVATLIEPIRGRADGLPPPVPTPACCCPPAAATASCARRAISSGATRRAVRSSRSTRAMRRSARRSSRPGSRMWSAWRAPASGRGCWSSVSTSCGC